LHQTEDVINNSFLTINFMSKSKAQPENKVEEVAPVAETPVAETEPNFIPVGSEEIKAYQKYTAVLENGTKVQARTYKWDAMPEKVLFEAVDGSVKYNNVIGIEVDENKSEA
jgi:hypothetical protein